MNVKVTVGKKNYENGIIFYSEESWKKDKSNIKKILGKDFTGKKQEHKILYDALGYKRAIIIGMGQKDKINLETFRKCANIAALISKDLKLEKVEFNLLGQIKNSGVAVVEGVILGQYSFFKYKEKESKEEVLIKEIILITRDQKQKITDAIITCNNVNLVRDLVNSSSDDINPLSFERISNKIAKKTNLKMKVPTTSEMKKMGLLNAVNRGSSIPPRLVILEYLKGKKKDPITALVGKGITFDAGGLNQKPTGYIEDMRMDMAGAASVLGIIKTIAEQKVKKNIIAVMPLTENMNDGKAYKPGDVIKSYSGKTVEIKNTDAEGRLALGDAISYTIKHYSPDLIIDMATLTGATLICLGDMAASIMGNDDKLAQDLQKLSHKDIVHERVWQLPIYEEARDAVKSKIADIKNLGFPKGHAGTITAGTFIEEFVEDTPWIHIDIAGTGMTNERKSYVPNGGTGFGVRLVVEYLKTTKVKKHKKK